MMPEPFAIVDASEIKSLGREPIRDIRVSGIEAQLIVEVLEGQEHAEIPDLDGVQDFEKEGIYKSAVEDCVNAFRLMRAIRG
jgi:hypothetical protein